MWLINAYDQKVINRILLPDINIQIAHTYLAQSHDLFIVCDADDEYNLYYVNLDVFENMKEQLNQRLLAKFLFSYKKTKVNQSPLVAMHVRASSVKEKIKMNQKLIVFFLHKGSLWSWTEGDE